ncbi:hypothetical protein NESM_000147300 [Novymonas esmeraldas]|uniref:Uncharacterized protein n=1 Tax=Novymonas esmeraldas TaxID=1808958 RepID=A0AAW0F6G0_9TRYP
MTAATKDATSSAGATALPSTCGEETDLPGVPRVGCVAAISYKPHTLHGFSACVVGTADGVALLGPDLARRRHGHHCLLTRHLWRPVTPADASGRRRGAPDNAGVQSTSSGSGVHAMAHTEASCASIVAVTACLVSEADSGGGGVEDDTVAIVVAWSDAALQHRVTVLSVHLRCALTPSVPATAGAVDAGLAHVVAHDVLPLHPTQSVLRLFHHHDMAAPSHGQASHHVVMCSIYSPWNATAPSAGLYSHSDATTGASGASASAAAKKSHTAVGGGGGGGGGGEAVARRRGELLFLTLSCEATTNDGGAAAASSVASHARDGGGCTSRSLRMRAGRSAESEVAPWLLQFRPDRVICAFAVQSIATSVIAAAGTIDGRVYLLGPTSQRLVRRVGGPVADAMFVRTKAARAPSQSRHIVVDSLLADAVEEDTLKNGSFTSQADEEYARRDRSDFAALVVLDSSGHLLVLRAVNSGAIITQSVADIPQMITLANGQQQTLTFVNASMASLEEAAQVSSRNFLDLSSLRHFFRRRRPPLPHPPPPHPPPRRMMGHSNPSTANPPLSTSSLTTSPINQSFTHSADEATLVGHILSRGLLCVACITNTKGCPELVVSTMGQVVVSVPFSPLDGCFHIAGFTVTPAPMFYVNFVDFFADGNPTLVMAGLKNVLVASRPQPNIRDRALLLLRLLNKKERELHDVVSDGVAT